MKKIAIIFAALIIFSSLAFAASLPTILVDKVDPQPAEPGKDITIDITLFNKETRETGDFSVTFETSYPIILKSSTEDLTKVNLCGGCSKKNKYFLTIDSSAVSGTYPVYIKALSGGSEISQRVDITVKGIPNIIFSADSLGLNNITPNTQFFVDLNLTNIGSGSARQIKIQPESINFVTLGGSIQTIDTLGPSKSKIASFNFLPSSSLDANSYTIPIKISYLDDQGNSINTSQNLGVKVVNKGQLSIKTIKVVSDTGSTIISKDQPFTIIIRLENVGKGTANSITANLECPFTEKKKSFLGQLKKDEDAPVVFNIVSNKDGDFQCGLNVSYEDDTGSYQLTEKFDVNVQSPGYLGMIFVLLIIIPVALVIFRKRVPVLKNI
ncbi:MAG: hypothetical protein HY831_02810 [Candidatus Aenigmarchaeota archaeon]|nr:hypothetical protein [Candidatus Aenigmarchaeota archaeon]